MIKDIAFYLLTGLLMNIFFLISGAIALSKADRAKSYTTPLIIGSIITFIPVVTMVFAISTIISTIIFYFLFLFLYKSSCAKRYNEAVEYYKKAEEMDNQEKLKE